MKTLGKMSKLFLAWKQAVFPVTHFVFQALFLTHIAELFPQTRFMIIRYAGAREELLLIPDQCVPGHETEQLPSHDGNGLLQLPLARHVIFWGPTRWYPELHTKVTLLLYVLPVEMASAFSMEGCSPQVIPRIEENWLFIGKESLSVLSVIH